MSFDLPSTPNPRAELEAQVTALLLGELPADEAARLRELIARDDDLRELQERLSLTLEYVRETAAKPQGETPAQPAPLRLSAAKRDALRLHFKTIRLEEFSKPRRNIRDTIFLIAGAAAIVAFMAAITLPHMGGTKTKGMESIASLSRNNGGKLELALPSATPPPQAAAAPTPVEELRDRRQIEDQTKATSQVQQNIALPKIADGQWQLAADDNGQGQNKQQTQKPAVANAETDFAFIGGSLTRSAPATTLNAWQGKTAGETEGVVNGTIQVERENIPVPTGLPTLSPPAVSVPNSGELAGADTSFYDSLGVDKKAAKENAPAAAAASPGQSSFQNDLSKFRDQNRQGVESVNGNVSSGFAWNAANPQGAFPSGKTDRELTAREKMAPATRIAEEPKAAVPPEVSGQAKFAEVVQNEGTIGIPQGFGNADTAHAVQKLGMQSDIPAPIVTTTSGRAALNSDGSLDRSAAQNGTNPFVGRYDINIKYANSVDISGALKKLEQNDAPLSRPAPPTLTPQPEVLTSVNAFTTISLNVSDVAFRLAQASLQNGLMPEPGSMRSEEFINAFDYRDPEPAPGAPIGFAWERAADPFAHHRDFLRFSIKTAAQGREAGRPLNLVLLLDKSGSMERADRVEIVARALRVLATQLQPGDTLSVVVFARTARLFVDGVPGSQAGEVAKDLRKLTPEGGTNLEEAMRLAYATALRHYLANGENRVVLLTDGAANLGNVDPAALRQTVSTNRRQGIALDCFGVGWDGYNDPMLETLSRAGNGRYGFVNTPQEADTEFAGKLAGALRVAAADVKVQVEFNPRRVTSYRQIGYGKDQLKKEDFRDNSVKAAQIGAAEAGNGLYTVEINPSGEGPVCTVRVRFRVPGTETHEEHQWEVPYTGTSVALEQASPAMRLTAMAAAFSESLAASPYAGEVTPDRLLHYLRGVPQAYGADTRPANLEWMIRQVKSISGK